MKWEYKILTGYDELTEQALNGLGVQGWELVGVTTLQQPSGAPAAPLVSGAQVVAGAHLVVMCIFKRQRE